VLSIAKDNNNTAVTSVLFVAIYSGWLVGWLIGV
jgi:hypothetical protein